MAVKFEYEFKALEIDSVALTRAVQNAAANVANNFSSSDMSDALSPLPGAVKYPVDWTRSPIPSGRWPNMPDGTYSKQKAAFFATDGFGKGIPTKRTGKLGKSWTMTSEDVNEAAQSGAEILITNSASYAKYVIGAPPGTKPMQGFHLNTGWQPLEPRQITFAERVVDDIQSAVEDELQQAILIKER